MQVLDMQEGGRLMVEPGKRRFKWREMERLARSELQHMRRASPKWVEKGYKTAEQAEHDIEVMSDIVDEMTKAADLEEDWQRTVPRQIARR